MAVDHCTKCKEDGHKTFMCKKKPWSFHDEQECDNCGKGSRGHDIWDCPTGKLPQIRCAKCGHGGHHYPHVCPIEDSRIEANRNQYTRTKYEDAMSKIAKENAKKSKSAIGGTTSTGGPSNSNARSTGGKLPVRNKPVQLTLSEKKEQMKAERKERIKQLETKRLERTAKEERWRAREIEMPGFMPGETALNKEIVANFFTVRIPAQPIHKYRIELDKIDGEEPRNHTFRRKLIENLLGNNPPDAKIWAPDYFSHVISVGKLFNKCADTENTPYVVKYIRPKAEMMGIAKCTPRLSLKD